MGLYCLHLSIVICCESSESSIFEAIHSHRHFFEEAFFDSTIKKAELCPPPQPLLVVHTTGLHQVSGQGVVGIFPKGASRLPLHPQQLFAVIINSACAHPLLEGVPVLRCGLCSDDTLTFSSYQQERAVVSLQEPLHTIGGQTVEPQEIPICIQSHMTPFDILALCALLLLGDRGGSIGEMTF